MTQARSFKRTLAAISRLQDAKAFDRALVEVDAAIEGWPGNAGLQILRSKLVQLQEEPTVELEEAKTALEKAIDLDADSPAASIELGYFLDNVEDDPSAAVKALAVGVAAARKLLIDGLIGQAKAYRQLGKKKEFLRSLLEILYIVQFSGEPKRKANGDDIEMPFGLPFSPRFLAGGSLGEEIQELLSDYLSETTA